MTGEKRLTPISRCDRYAPLTTKTPRGEKDMPEPTKKKRTNWNAVISDIDNGTHIDDVAKAHGLTPAQIKTGLAKRQWYENAKTSKRTAADVNIKPNNKTLATPSKAPNSTAASMVKKQESVNMATPSLSDPGNLNVREVLVGETFNRISKIMGLFSEGDNINVKGAALVTVHEIIKQASAQLEV